MIGLLVALVMVSPLRAQPVSVGAVEPYFVQNFGYVCRVAFGSFPPEGVVFSALMSPAPPGFYWNPAQGINALPTQGTTTYLIRQGGPAQNVLPFAIGWRKWSVTNGVPGPETQENYFGVADGRTPEQKVNSPVFKRAHVQERNGQWHIYGSVESGAGPTIYEYWDGAQWRSMRNHLGSNTLFLGFIPKGVANPLIRSYKVATPGAISWVHPSTPPVISHGTMRARIISLPANRFNVKSKTATMGVRG